MDFRRCGGWVGGGRCCCRYWLCGLSCIFLVNWVSFFWSSVGCVFMIRAELGFREFREFFVFCTLRIDV